MRLIVTRPAIDAGPLRAKLEAAGHRVTTLPLLRIVPRDLAPIPERTYQAVVATSANGIRAAASHDRLKTLRLLTVGAQSLAAARQAGFANSAAHGGDVEGLAQFIGENLNPALGAVLYLSGSETAGDLQGLLRTLGFTVERVILYDAVAATHLSGIAIGDHDGVLLYSPRTARIWTSLAGDARHLRHFCLSENVAAALPGHWPKSVAAAPDEPALLALLDPSL